MRIYALYVVILFLSVYAWKDWFKCLCGLVVMMAFFKHEDMPTSMFGIQGLNPWNILFGVNFLAWAISRRREGCRSDMPSYMKILLLMYLGVVVIGALRAIFDRTYIEDYPLKNLISEELVNTVKWVLPGLLLFDGCTSRSRVVMVLACLLILYFLFGVQIVRYMPMTALADGDTMKYARAGLGRYMGYSAPDLCTMLAGASWGMLSALPLMRKKGHRAIVWGMAGVVILAMALTGGRMGYTAWGGTGLFLCLLKWRKQLILAPLVVSLVPMLFPGVAARMLSGFGETDVTGQTTVDENMVTSGRTVAWPYVIEKISESPWMGYGRLAMRRTGVQHQIGVETGDFAFPHPHNMYLETLLDNGIVGSLPILLLWATVACYSTRLFISSNRLYAAVGGLSVALTLTSLLSGIGGQHFYPQEQTFGLWVASFLALRVHVEEKRASGCIDDARDLTWGHREGFWLNPSLGPTT